MVAQQSRHQDVIFASSSAVGLNCVFLVFDGFSNMVLASAVEPLRAARDFSKREPISWKILSIEGRDVVTSSGLVIRSDGDLTSAADADALFIVAGYGARNQAGPIPMKALSQLARKVPIVGALDSGAWILAAAGLLSGHRATVHWQDLVLFSEEYLDIEVVPDNYVIDGKRVTAGDATSVLALMLHLIREHGGGALAFDVANMFVFGKRPAVAPQSARASWMGSREPRLLRAVEAMHANLERPLSIELLALKAATSPRSLVRLFNREFGLSPGDYYRRLRLNVARSLAEETPLSAGEIATRTGFGDPSSLSRAFRQFFGLTLGEAKRRHAVGRHPQK